MSVSDSTPRSSTDVELAGVPNDAARADGLEAAETMLNGIGSLLDGGLTIGLGDGVPDGFVIISESLRVP